ncbi:MAG TPA: M1 family metallopeptidase [Myxococcaceae bacterium]|nr:M1 family metallopeptidase [Myxococcaceae bacterium]
MTVRPPLLVALLMLVACAAGPTAAPRAPTTPPPVAAASPPPPALVAPEGIKLPRTFRPAAQRVSLTVVPSAPGFTGRTEIDGTLDAATDVVWLNADALEVTSAAARVGTDEVRAEPVVRTDERVALRFPRQLFPGPLTLILDFRGTQFTQEDSGIFRQQSGGDWYAFTQFEQTDARRAFPCVDEPSAKIPWELTLRVPAGLTAVSNTSVASETPAGEGTKEVRFRQTRPLPSYLVAFGVGPFEMENARPAGRRRVPVRIVAPRGRAHEGAWAARVTPEILEALEEYFGIDYPYEKLDVLAIPFTVQFGAMENVGLVTFREALVLSRAEQDRVERRRGYATVAAHEFAHQWFGDLVTAAWWDDIWLNEAFATWMETKVIERWAPAWGMAAERVEQRNVAAETDALVSTRVIRQPVQSYDDAKNAFDSITYEKGAAVLRMFEQWVGPETFRRGIQRYLRTHADGNATARDFLRAISEAAGREVAPAFDTFLDRPGIPRIQATVRCGAQGAVLQLSQERWLPAGSSGDRGGVWQVPVCTRWSTRGKEQTHCTLLDTPSAEVKLEARACPDWVLPNAGYAGYYRLQLDPGWRARLVRSGKLDDAERVGLLGDTEALVRGGALSRAEGLQLAARYAGAREHHVVRATLQLATVREDFLAGRLAPAYAAWVTRVFAPHARALGLRRRPAEDDEIQLTRPLITEFVARRGEDPQLVAEARTLAEAWLSQPRAVAPEMVSPVLMTAGRFGGRDLHQALVQRLDRTADIDTRDWLLEGLASTRVPELLDDNVALATSGRLNPREITKLLTGGRKEAEPPLDSVVGRSRVLAGVDRSWSTLVALMPRGGLTRFFALAGESCSVDERAEGERVFGPRVKSILGGPRRFALALERLDLCSDQRTREVPTLEKFFPEPRPTRAATGG